MLRFDSYMRECLYGEHRGFYTTRGAAGRTGGDFITSPEVGPLFGEVTLEWVMRRWDDLGRPSEFDVVEAAAGRGALAIAFLSALTAESELSARRQGFREALRYRTVELSPALREAQIEHLEGRVVISGSMPESIASGVVLANELLDNMPFRIMEKTGDGWSEVFVDTETGAELLVEIDAGHLGELKLAASGPVHGTLNNSLPLDVAVGTRVPLQREAGAWVSDALSRFGSGSVLALDYGVRTTPELVGRQWLRTYAGHVRGDDPYVTPGSVDITADVAFDQLPPATRLTVQAEWLRTHGIDELVAEGRRTWAERGSIGDLPALRARSRVAESEALLDPAGLGSFLVAEWDV